MTGFGGKDISRRIGFAAIIFFFIRNVLTACITLLPRDFDGLIEGYLDVRQPGAPSKRDSMEALSRRDGPIPAHASERQQRPVTGKKRKRNEKTFYVADSKGKWRWTSWLSGPRKPGPCA